MKKMAHQHKVLNEKKITERAIAFLRESGGVLERLVDATTDGDTRNIGEIEEQLNIISLYAKTGEIIAKTQKTEKEAGTSAGLQTVLSGGVQLQMFDDEA